MEHRLRLALEYVDMLMIVNTLSEHEIACHIKATLIR